MTKPTRIKAPAIRSKSEFDATVDELARIEVELRKLTARQDARIQTIRAEFEPAITALQTQQEALALIAEKFAEENRDEILPGKLKSAETQQATYGFRYGNKVLKTLSRAWTWARVVEALEAGGEAMARFVRVEKSADKDGMKLHLTTEQLASVGCRIDQAETFFVEAKDRSDAAA